MRSLRIAVAFSWILCACGGSSRGGATTPAAGESAMDAARRAVEVWRQAWEADSVDRIAALYAHDPNLVMVQQGVAFSGWDAVSAHLKDVLGHAREIHIKLGNVQVAELGADDAVVVASMDRDVSDGTVTTSERGVLTLVLHRVADGWVVVSEHYSYPGHS